MSKVKKYLRNDSLSPLWVEREYNKACDKHELEMNRKLQEQNVNIQQQGFIELMNKLLESTKVNETNDQMMAYATKVMATKVNNNYSLKNSLNDRFEFLKSHSDNQQDFEIAKYVLSTLNENK